MKDIYPLAGITKQGFHQSVNREIRIIQEQEDLLPMIQKIRNKHKALASRKIYNMIKPSTMGSHTISRLFWMFTTGKLLGMPCLIVYQQKVPL